MNQIQPNATSPQASLDFDEAGDDEISAIDDVLTQTLKSKLDNPVSSPEFDLHAGVNEVLRDVGMTAADSGGKLTFYGQDPIVPSCLRFGAMSAISLAAKAVAAAAIWKLRSGEEQDIHVDVRKALRRFAPFFEREWERVNGHPASFGSDPETPFFSMPIFYETRDGRHVMPLNIFPRLRARAINFLRCSESAASVRNAILQWRADELEMAGAEAGIVMGKLRTNEEFLKELQYSEVLSKEPLIRLEKIGESDPMPFKAGGKTPLDGVRAGDGSCDRGIWYWQRSVAVRGRCSEPLAAARYGGRFFLLDVSCRHEVEHP